MAYLVQRSASPQPAPVDGGGGGRTGLLGSLFSSLRPGRRTALTTATSAAVAGAPSRASAHTPSSRPCGLSASLSEAPQDPSQLSTRLEDASLYRFAVDYDELVAVMNAPCADDEGHPVTRTSTLAPHVPPTTTRRGDGTTTATTTAAASPASTGDTASKGLLSPESLHFKCIGEDPKAGILLSSSPVPDCPVHLMRASVVMPCSASDFLQYMDNRVRPLWDTYTEKGYLVRELTSPDEVEAQLAEAHKKPRTESLKVTPNSSEATRTAASSSAARTSSTDSAASRQPFAYLPGQRRVALHYLATRSPVPFLQSRDFELVVTEEVCQDGTAYMKAFSAPFGYCVPVDVEQNRYVRAVCLSGVVARPLTAVSAKDPASLVPPTLRHLIDSRQLNAFMNDGSVSAPSRAFCEVSYYGLVHPMGMIPPVLVNMVISAQMSSLRTLQTFIEKNPLSSLLPAGTRAPAQTHTRSSASSTSTLSTPSAHNDGEGPSRTKPTSWRERLLAKL